MAISFPFKLFNRGGSRFGLLCPDVSMFGTSDGFPDLFLRFSRFLPLAVPLSRPREMTKETSERVRDFCQELSPTKIKEVNPPPNQLGTLRPLTSRHYLIGFSSLCLQRIRCDARSAVKEICGMQYATLEPKVREVGPRKRGHVSSPARSCALNSP